MCMTITEELLTMQYILIALELNLYSPNDYGKNDKIFSTTKKMKKIYRVICGKYRKFEKPKISYL